MGFLDKLFGSGGDRRVTVPKEAQDQAAAASEQAMGQKDVKLTKVKLRDGSYAYIGERSEQDKGEE